jgi:hypothetical protein
VVIWCKCSAREIGRGTTTEAVVPETRWTSSGIQRPASRVADQANLDHALPDLVGVGRILTAVGGLRDADS